MLLSLGFALIIGAVIEDGRAIGPCGRNTGQSCEFSLTSGNAEVYTASILLLAGGLLFAAGSAAFVVGVWWRRRARISRDRATGNP